MEFILPKWCLVFIFLCILIPIFSIESIFPWIICIFFSSKCIKVSINNYKTTKIKLLKCISYCATAIVLGLIFNLLVLKGTTFFMQNIL
ncbi:hypothetical protein BD780_002269 [Clostridium tetanomorphum]|nr:hypothetical protein CTM_02769 [Clostridium tetanomorphum DSM 665]MBP1863966.1 hypothetical protein [Clostridium tetanomorphum]NRS85044.1 hypothetical protein [Clostridium tetanomorphum]NRZ98260.1 hypothetical protein [Clostridium tetanomorphum]SQB91427.1 Uncharacterised protein [Clostridium tetanomorphum]